MLQLVADAEVAMPLQRVADGLGVPPVRILRQQRLEVATAQRAETRSQPASRAHAQELKEDGMRLYSEGRVEDAAAQWKRALKLDPTNSEAQKLLERAGRVLEKKANPAGSSRHSPG